jgi:hypothetical protein
MSKKRDLHQHREDRKLQKLEESASFRGKHSKPGPDTNKAKLLHPKADFARMRLIPQSLDQHYLKSQLQV